MRLPKRKILTMTVLLVSVIGSFVTYKLIRRSIKKKQGYIYKSEINVITPAELVVRAKRAWGCAWKGNDEADRYLSQIQAIIKNKIRDDKSNAELWYALALVTSDNSRDQYFKNAFSMATIDKSPMIVFDLYKQYLMYGNSNIAQENELRDRARRIAYYRLNLDSIEPRERIQIIGLLRDSVKKFSINPGPDFYREMKELTEVETRMMSNGLMRGCEDILSKMIMEDGKVVSVVSITPKIANLEQAQEQLKREIDEYVALGMKPLEMTMGKRLDGSSGMMTIEERYDINAKKAETIASEIKELRKQMGISSTDEESDFGRCRDYASYVEYKQKENVQREKDGLETEKLLVLNGIAREVGMSYDAMMTMYNKKRTFSAALNGVYEGRKMLMRAMRKTGSSIPMHDYQQIQQLRAIAMNPNLP